MCGGLVRNRLQKRRGTFDCGQGDRGGASSEENLDLRDDPNYPSELLRSKIYHMKRWGIGRALHDAASLSQSQSHISIYREHADVGTEW